MKKILTAAIVVLIAGGAYLSIDAQTTSQPKSTTKERPEILIIVNQDDSALIRGAQVTGIKDNTLYTKISKGSLDLNITVDVSSTTKIVGQNASTTIPFSNIKNGDKVSFRGKLAPSASVPTISATVLRDWSK